MARALIWSAEARADLKQIEAYITLPRIPLGTGIASSLKSARRQTSRWTSPTRRELSLNFRDPNRREIFVYQYRLMYRIQPHRIRVLRVIHGRRLLKNMPGSFEESAQADYRAA